MFFLVIKKNCVIPSSDLFTLFSIVGTKSSRNRYNTCKKSLRISNKTPGNYLNFDYDKHLVLLYLGNNINIKTTNIHICIVYRQKESLPLNCRLKCAFTFVLKIIS